VRYYQWAVALDPQTPHAARFQCAVVYDFRRHDRTKSLELYHQVIDLDENHNESNCRFSATRIEQLTDEDRSHLTPKEPLRPVPAEPVSSPPPPPARADMPAAKTPAKAAAPAAKSPAGADMPPPLTRTPARTPAPAVKTPPTDKEPGPSTEDEP
jgi:hypothetical protein